VPPRDRPHDQQHGNARDREGNDLHQQRAAKPGGGRRDDSRDGEQPQGHGRREQFRDTQNRGRGQPHDPRHRIGLPPKTSPGVCLAGIRRRFRGPGS
jgi:hypothetical protein